MKVEGNSLFEITVDHDLWRLAKSFSALYEDMEKISNSVSAINKNLKKNGKEIYDGRGTKELTLFLESYKESMGKLSKLYLYCSLYVNDTLSIMLEFDESLKQKFEQGVIQYATEYPDAATKLFGTGQ